ncbi:hypothetical protein ACP3TJ_11410 [Desulforudis sp. 1088]|uniref:hypothetical protein n=1 Tax=unclassified Candidatus Desulforudis TaxID=2635950 RepID=UPI003CE4A455
MYTLVKALLYTVSWLVAFWLWGTADTLQTLLEGINQDLQWSVQVGFAARLLVSVLLVITGFFLVFPLAFEHKGKGVIFNRRLFWTVSIPGCVVILLGFLLYTEPIAWLTKRLNGPVFEPFREFIFNAWSHADSILMVIGVVIGLSFMPSLQRNGSRKS